MSDRQSGGAKALAVAEKCAEDGVNELTLPLANAENLSSRRHDDESAAAGQAGNSKDPPGTLASPGCILVDASEDKEEAGKRMSWSSLLPLALHSVKGLNFWKPGRLQEYYDSETLIFSLRVAVSMTLASLFTIIPLPNGASYPQPQWIGASAGIVAWQNTLDTASAIKRAVERTTGTLVGALLGLCVGFMSLWASAEPSQASVLGIAMAVICFVFPYASTCCGWRDSYAARMTLVTYSIVSLSFFRTPDCLGSAWSIGMWRAINIVVGCFVGVASLVLWPRSTSESIRSRVRDQVQVAGESVECVLNTAYDAFMNRQKPPHWDSYLRGDSGPLGERDPAYLTAYVRGAHGWKDCSELFALLKYDPSLFRSPNEERKKLQESTSIISERVFRLHTTLVVLDSVVRGGVSVLVDDGIRSIASDPSTSFDVLKRIGERTRTMLNAKGGASAQEREEAFEALINEDLVQVGRWMERQERHLMQRKVSTFADVELPETPTSQSQIQRLLLSKNDNTAKSPMEFLQGHQQVSLFFLLVEQLILRAARLYCLSQDLLQ